VSGRKEQVMEYLECLTINNVTSKAEVRELTPVMAENLSEIATVVSLNFTDGKARVWENRVERVERVDYGTLAEWKRRIVWRDEHVGLFG